MSRINGHEARINDVLRVAYQREGRAVITSETPLTIAEVFEQAPGDGEEELRIKGETVMRFLLFIFQDGPHPGCTMRLLYLLTQRLKPELLLNMSGAELADMFGETRAAWSARQIRMFNGYLRARGARAVKGRNQKSDSAAASYASAARGNTNRRGKTKRAA